MRHKDVLEIWGSAERHLTEFCGFSVASCRTDPMLSMLLTVRDRPWCYLFATYSDNKVNTASCWIISIFSIPSECSLFSYNETVALKIMLNNQSSLYIRKNFPFSQKKRKNNITLSNLVLFSVCMTRNKSLDFQLSIDVNGIMMRFI